MRRLYHRFLALLLSIDRKKFNRAILIISFLVILYSVFVSFDSALAVTADPANQAPANAAVAEATTPIEPQATAQETTSGASIGDRIALKFAGLIMGFAGVLGIIITKVLSLIIMVMTYNGFATSPVVGAGWSVVRDTMNMGFVIVLLAIAFGTIIVGPSGAGGRFNWSKSLPKLLLFAVLINFSRTICVLIIDVSQVFMLTFANAIKDIAGGNFFQLFGMQDMLQLSEEGAKALEANGGYNIFDFFAAAVAAVVMFAIILSNVVMLLVMLVYRIVILWILIVLSPLAFFFGGAGSVTKGGGLSDPYSKWWSKFMGAVLIGPILIFFMWLALAVAGSGSIAADENFALPPPDSGANSPGIATKIFELDRLISFVIGIGILFAGLEVAQEASGALPGQMKSLIGEARKRAEGYVRAPVGLAKAGAAKGARTAGAAALGLAGMAGGYQIKGGRLEGRRVREVPQAVYAGTAERARAAQAKGGVTGAVAGVVARAAGRKEEQARRAMLEGHQNATERIKPYSIEQMRAELSAPAITRGGQMDQQAMRYRMLSDGKFLKEMKPEELQKVRNEFMKNGGNTLLNADPNMEKTVKEVSMKRPELAAKEGQDSKARQEEMKTFFSDKFTSASDYRNISENSLEDADVRAALEASKTIVRVGDKYQEISVSEAMRGGRLGESLQKKLAQIETVATAESPEIVYQGKMADMVLRVENTENVMGRQIADAETSGDAKLVGELKKELGTAREEQRKMMQDFLKANPDFLRVANAGHATAGNSMLTRTLLTTGTPAQLSAARENTELRTAIAGSASGILNQTTETDKRVEMRANIFLSTGGDKSAFDAIPNIPISEQQAESALTVEQILRRDPAQLSAIQSAGVKENTIMEALASDATIITEMMQKLRDSKGTPNEAILKDSVQQLATFIEQNRDILGSTGAKKDNVSTIENYLKVNKRHYA